MQEAIKKEKAAVSAALQALETEADQLEQALPAVERQKEKAKAAAKVLDRSVLGNFKSQKRLPEHLDHLLNAGDILKGKGAGAWRRDMQYASAFIESFQKFDLDSVSMETFAQLKPITTADWFVAGNFKG